ncbi:hypothetical protein [Streptomyces sp. NBC_01794]|uniref:hypothetical protein n=1 Tax=Streptomyces sp. NBC_01794 TaxID=2975942 RepID=UPI00308FA62F|nr:hypothetical protein OIE54_26075 [Streptomyces sp. NBC_01794]
MSEPDPPSVPSASAVRKLAHGVRYEGGLAHALAEEPWPLEAVLRRAAELELIRGRHLTDAGRLVLAEPAHWRLRKAAEEALDSANFVREKWCWCGSCAETGLYDSSGPYYPVSLREGR